jgi:hypothetical protein
LYLLPKSDDASHDEALSSRVAALNMLDLGLEHLGVDVGAAGAGVTAVLKACGESAHLESWDFVLCSLISVASCSAFPAR